MERSSVILSADHPSPVNRQILAGSLQGQTQS